MSGSIAKHVRDIIDGRSNCVADRIEIVGAMVECVLKGTVVVIRTKSNEHRAALRNPRCCCFPERLKIKTRLHNRRRQHRGIYRT